MGNGASAHGIIAVQGANGLSFEAARPSPKLRPKFQRQVGVQYCGTSEEREEIDCVKLAETRKLRKKLRQRRDTKTCFVENISKLDADPAIAAEIAAIKAGKYDDTDDFSEKLDSLSKIGQSPPTEGRVTPESRWSCASIATKRSNRLSDFDSVLGSSEYESDDSDESHISIISNSQIKTKPPIVPHRGPTLRRIKDDHHPFMLKTSSSDSEKPVIQRPTRNSKKVIPPMLAH